MVDNETLDIILSSDNETSDSYIVYIILFSVFNNKCKYIYGYLCLFLSLFKK